MELSVVISTLNDRESLVKTLDTLDQHTPSTTEVIVVNGPSTDGTTGMVRDRTDVDVLVEIAERNQSVSWNAGIGEVTTGVVALLGSSCLVDPDWYDAIETAMQTGADVLTGPIKNRDDHDLDPKTPITICSRTITTFYGDNVVFDRAVLDALDGFDEYLASGAVRDCSHRIAGLGYDVTWNGQLVVRDTGEKTAPSTEEPGREYRSRAYCFGKNYGLRPTIAGRTALGVFTGGIAQSRSLVGGDETLTNWFGTGISVLQNTARGFWDGLVARYEDQTPRRNPHGQSTRHDRAVKRYDFR